MYFILFKDTKLNWEENDVESEDREGSPPMPTIPPPPPPLLSDEPTPWTDSMNFEELISEDDPYAIALFDYFTDHPDDLCFSVSVFNLNFCYRKSENIAIFQVFFSLSSHGLKPKQ